MNTKPRLKWHVSLTCLIGLAGVSSAAVAEKYTYDASGNITEKVVGASVTKMSYDSLNRLTSSETNGLKETYAYDAAGRRQAVKSSNGRIARSTVHGYADRVMEVTDAGRKSQFFYDANGKLVAKKGEGRSTLYAWDGNTLASEGDLAFTNEQGGTGGVPVIQGGSEAVVSDYLGTTLLAGDRAFKSSAFGEGMEGGRLTGKMYVEELDCFVFPFRNYSPSAGSWTSADPSGFPDGANNYAYVEGDPLSNYDPSGLVTMNWAGPTEYIGLGVTTVPGAPTNTGGTIKVVTVNKPGGHVCYRPEVNAAYAFTFTGCEVKVPKPGETYDGGALDATFKGTTTTHENWHKTHYTTIAGKTYGALETWSAAYSGNEFATSAAAQAAGDSDFSTAKTAAHTKWDSQCSRTEGHELANPATFAEKVDVAGTQTWRSQNPDWGQPLETELQKISMTFTKTAGNCEH